MIPVFYRGFDGSHYVAEYAENTNYKADFEELNQRLREIEENTAKEEEPDLPPRD